MGNFEEENKGLNNSREENARPRRPRITKTEHSYNSEKVYGGRNANSGFPEGFGSRFHTSDRSQHSARPRMNSARPNNRQSSPYQSHDSHYRQDNNQREGYASSYKPHPYSGGSQYRSQNTGYRSTTQREGNQQRRSYQQGYNRQQGYQPYGSYQHNRQGGYNPMQKFSIKRRVEYSEQNIDPDAPIRINKFLANAGICSRREADDFVQAGVITVNGEVITELGTKVTRNDDVRFHNQPVTLEKKVYVLLNKPKDYVTTTDDPQQRKTVLELVKNACRERIYPVGRLDRNTTGVLLLTNDGDLASKLTHPKFLKKKVYHVRLDKNMTKHDMEQLIEGITLDDGEIHADAIEYADDTDKSQIGIEIHSGRNRIVRRMFEALGYHVTKLDRTMFAGLTKKNVRRGDWRYLTEKEVNILRTGAFE